jgi:hypothetical protein
MTTRPFVFVGSSSEGLTVAKALQSGLTEAADITLWTQGIFQPSYGYLESLVKALDQADFAILILTPDDTTASREQELNSPRDNVIFELGLFIGRLGRRRCFFVHEKAVDLKIPSDLLGISGATYRSRSDNNLQAALGPVCTSIETRMSEVGIRTRMLKFTPDELLASAAVPDISGDWAGFSPDGPSPEIQNSTLFIEQRGSFIRATVIRTVRERTRTFDYEGRFTAGQLVLFFEDKQGRGYIVGTTVLHLSPDLRTLSGLSTYFAHAEGTVTSRSRLYRRVESAVQ